MAKGIDVDDEVWSELQKRAKPFEDTPNSVLRRLVGLSDISAGPGAAPPGWDADSPLREPRGRPAGGDRLLATLLEKAGLSHFPGASFDGTRWAGRLDTGTPIVAYLNVQKKGLKLEVKKSIAAERSLTGEREQPKGWFGIDDCLVWYVRNGNQRDMATAATVLSSLFGSKPTAELRLEVLNATAGAWDGLVDCEDLERHIYEDREINDRPEPKL